MTVSEAVEAAKGALTDEEMVALIVQEGAKVDLAMTAAIRIELRKWADGPNILEWQAVVMEPELVSHIYAWAATPQEAVVGAAQTLFEEADRILGAVESTGLQRSES